MHIKRSRRAACSTSQPPPPEPPLGPGLPGSSLYCQTQEHRGTCNLRTNLRYTLHCTPLQWLTGTTMATTQRAGKGSSNAIPREPPPASMWDSMTSCTSSSSCRPITQPILRRPWGPHSSPPPLCPALDPPFLQGGISPIILRLNPLALVIITIKKILVIILPQITFPNIIEEMIKRNTYSKRDLAIQVEGRRLLHTLS